MGIRMGNGWEPRKPWTLRLQPEDSSSGRGSSSHKGKATCVFSLAEGEAKFQ